MPRPTFSIIVPTYRRREPLARCLQAIAALDYPRDDFEVIVVDDGSPDPPADLVGALAPAVDARLATPPHGGPAAARNAGAALARGRYLAFTDDDCAPDPGWLAAMRRATHAGDVSAAVGGRTVNVFAGNIYAAASQTLVDYLYEYFRETDNAAGQFFTSNNLVIPRDGFLAIGGFDERFPLAAGEDRDLCERWSRQGGRLVHVPDAVVHHGHALSFRRFSRQHFSYGRGAFDLHRSRARRGNRRLRLEPVRFYTGLVVYPLRHYGGLRALSLAALHLWSQVVYAAGYLTERTSRGWRVPAPHPTPGGDR